ncbi:hypothetical protein TIFTF001_009570 [Ficus carica]|uniref:Uncharacterized protein n=1 Tax=Ficus carica TaxID=3494 RepID=A0AA87ZWQ1_FICCA|nr:hypothetical protein TIFTF001_009570 [Ficus carica]
MEATPPTVGHHPPADPANPWALIQPTGHWRDDRKWSRPTATRRPLHRILPPVALATSGERWVDPRLDPQRRAHLPGASAAAHHLRDDDGVREAEGRTDPVERRRRLSRSRQRPSCQICFHLIGGLHIRRRDVAYVMTHHGGRLRGRRPAGAGSGGGGAGGESPTSGVGRRRPRRSPTAGRSPATEKTLGGKDNVR